MSNVFGCVSFPAIPEHLDHQSLLAITVVFFDQRLGAAHPKRCRSSHFQHFCAKKLKKCLKSFQFAAKISKKKCFFLVCKKTLVNCFIPKKRGAGSFFLLKACFYL